MKKALILISTGTLWLCGCATQAPPNPVPDPDTRDSSASTKISSTVGEVTGGIAQGATNVLIEIIPGLKSAIEVIDNQGQKLRERRRTKANEKSQNEQLELKREFCFTNPCQSSCKEFLENAIGVEITCSKQTSTTTPTPDPVLNSPSFNPTSTDSSRLVEHEGLRTEQYLDVNGFPHVGVGSRVYEAENVNFETSKAIADRFENDLKIAEKIAQNFSGLATWKSLNHTQRLALIECAFALGKQGLFRFVQMRTYLQSGDWIKAADELESSSWGVSDSARVESLARMLRNDSLN